MAFDGSAIQALLDGAVSSGRLHGIAAVLVDRNSLLFHHAAGEANMRTLFRNASMTKAVATTAALQLVEQGRLSLTLHAPASASACLHPLSRRHISRRFLYIQQQLRLVPALQCEAHHGSFGPTRL